MPGTALTEQQMAASLLQDQPPPPPDLTDSLVDDQKPEDGMQLFLYIILFLVIFCVENQCKIFCHFLCGESVQFFSTFLSFFVWRISAIFSNFFVIFCVEIQCKIFQIFFVYYTFFVIFKHFLVTVNGTFGIPDVVPTAT